ncbi:Mini-ribonuclease 3 [Clostridium aminobutyricum]|uniref:Mini-ribonuclease 3 n=1 Tax=Clostridium aminobutyricum TaxID=33953 RepID=A0A939DBV1_CLOAM|nr:ribonuclease III domain-containing protein [Clostridium aminobutyricum]MBN7774428.1 Mini-ribonuclease 3 [Clostridium aminobutyricum]
MEAVKMNTTALAYMGDAVYEMYVRQFVLERDSVNVDKQNKLAVRFVRAEGQAFAIKKMFDTTLTEQEQLLVKRARNKKITSKPQHADPVTYKLATAFEALIGFLYLSGDTERLEAIIRQALELIEKAEITDGRKTIKK